MSASSPRRLSFWLLIVGLTIPSQASAAPWDLGNLLARAGGYFSALLGQAGCVIEPSGCRAASPEGKSKPVMGDTGCVILPDGRCGA